MLVLRLYDTPIGVATRSGRDAPMPAISQEVVPVIRLLLWLLGGVLLGGIVHLATVLMLPSLATQDAYSRLAPIAPVNAVIAAPGAHARKSPRCRSWTPPSRSRSAATTSTEGPLKFSVPVSPAYTSVSFYTRTDVAYYAINDRAAGRRMIELDLMTTEQRNDLPGDEEITAADRLIVESPTPTGLIMIKALAAGMPMARRRSPTRGPAQSSYAVTRPHAAA